MTAAVWLLRCALMVVAIIVVGAVGLFVGALVNAVANGLVRL